MRQQREAAEAGPAAPAALPRRRWRQLLTRCIVIVYLALRISTLGFTLLLPIVGAASTAGEWSTREVLWLLLMALAFHTFAYVGNDVADLEIDRSEPLRADSPLVLGIWSRGQALALTLAQVPLTFAAAWAAGAGPLAMVALAAALLGMAGYNLWGKTARRPLLTDALQSAAWCALLLVGAALADRLPGRASAWICVYVFAAVMLVNGVHGSLRDLINDARCGGWTTAMSLGATPSADGAVVVSATLVRYAWALQVVLVTSAHMAWHELAGRLNDALLAAAALLVGAALSGSVVSLRRVFRTASRRQAFLSAIALNIVCTLAVLPALALPALGWSQGALLFALAAAPVLAMRAYNRSHWHLPNAMEGHA
ncbi:MAG: UbiA family prenyltransferase [Rubrivivax sp.]|nr:UbiA family prenyltransferase [Rubrivivax sp.]